MGATEALHRGLARWNMDESRLVFDAIGTKPGTMFEVGAHVGDETLLAFAERGWEVHAFEPDPGNRADLERRVRGLPNVRVIPMAAADRPGRMTLYTSPESTGISSLAPFTDAHRAAVEVEVTTLRDYARGAAVDRVDYLKMDVEGYEQFVLEGFPWDTLRPRVVLLEFEDAKTQPLGYGWRDLADSLRARGYVVLVSEWKPIVRYGAMHQWRRLAKYPCELADPEAWGNLLAIDPDLEARFTRLSRIAAPRARTVDLITAVRRRLQQAPASA